jgi:hypothetical protein
VEKVIFLCYDTLCGDVMGYGWFGRGWGFGPNLSPYCRWLPWLPRWWWANPAYASMMSTYAWGQPNYPQYSPYYLPSQGTLPYQWMRPTQPVSYPQAFTARMPVHMNCAYFSNGICALRGVSVPPTGPACQSFIPRV